MGISELAPRPKVWHNIESYKDLKGPSRSTVVLPKAPEEEKTKAKGKPKSYTQRLVDHLKDTMPDDDLDKVIIQIDAFAKLEFAKIKQQDALDSNLLYFGKYKNKTVLEVADFDMSYLKWLSKQNFIKPNLKASILEVL